MNSEVDGSGLLKQQKTRRKLINLLSLSGKVRRSQPIYAVFLTDFIIAAMGKIITDDEKNKESWDPNAITPGTPFMNLLAASLRYWVVKKMNTDPGWRDVRSERFLGILLTHFWYSCKSLSRMQVCLEKESIRLWTSYADNAQIPVMSLILDT